MIQTPLIQKIIRIGHIASSFGRFPSFNSNLDISPIVTSKIWNACKPAALVESLRENNKVIHLIDPLADFARFPRVLHSNDWPTRHAVANQVAKHPTRCLFVKEIKNKNNFFEYPRHVTHVRAEWN